MTPDARRILFVATSIGRGGAQRQIVDLAGELRRRGRMVAILSMIAATDEHLAELAAAGVSVDSLAMRPGRPTPAALVRYARFVRCWRPTVIHSHMVHANLLVRVGRPLAGPVPVVCTVHSVVEGRRWRTVAYRLTDPLANVTTAVSDAAAARCVRDRAVPQRRILTLRNGLDASRVAATPGARTRVRAELGIADGTFLWLAAGRLVEAKGYDLLLHAFDQLRGAVPVGTASRLVIAGDGPEEARLRDIVDRLGLADAVTMAGDRRDVPDLLAAADGLVSSSRWEGLPLILMEAAAARLPIVATAVGGCPEIARPAWGAVLVPPAIEAIAEGMRSVVRMDPVERARVGAQLSDHVRAAFDLGVTVDRWERLYGEVLAHQRGYRRVDWRRVDLEG